MDGCADQWVECFAGLEVEVYETTHDATFMIRVLPPWFENLGKRLVKSPKVYLRDSGILHFLLGIQEPEELPMHPRYGASWPRAPENRIAPPIGRITTRNGMVAKYG